MGEELTDTEINLVEENVNGFMSTLLQDKNCTLTEKAVRKKVQIIYYLARHH